jgi:ABC-type nitrate/sulfonate/bicarbonate transport system ATPase subunit
VSSSEGGSWRRRGSSRTATDDGLTAGQAPTNGSNPSSAPLLSIDQVGFAYPDGLRAIDSVSFKIRQGEVVSIIGPSGCGKSTLLRLLAGLSVPTSGRIDRKLTDANRHPCTMVFQEETLLPWLKVKDNAGLHFRFKRDRSRENREHVERLLKMVGLQDFGDYYPAKLSGGMKRRVAVLTAVAPLPEMLLLDEPFSALDEPTRIGVHRDIYKLVREFGISTTLVTHDLAEAITLSDRVLLLSRAPARIVGEYTVPFGEERNILDLRGTAEFLELYGRIWSDLEVQIKATQE